MARDNQDQYDSKEAKARFEAALKGAMSTSPKPLKDKPKVKKAKKKLASKKRTPPKRG